MRSNSVLRSFSGLVQGRPALRALVIRVAVAAIFMQGLAAVAAYSESGASPFPDLVHTIGTVNIAEPSGMGPPAIDVLPGYIESYVNDFTTTGVPAGWNVFTGIPGGDPGAHFGAKHVVFAGGLLRLNTWRDPAYKNRWVTGGLCQCGLSRIYGAYFARFRVTAAGPNEVALLWPLTDKWPPEIDFSETGATDLGTTSTVHFGATDRMDHRSIHLDMKQWHTWGVVWTPTSVIYVVDGSAWATVNTPSHIPRVGMTLDFEQRAMCALGRQCPTIPVSMLIDWVAEYVPAAP